MASSRSRARSKTSSTKRSTKSSARSKFGLLNGPGPSKNRRRNPLWRFRRFLLLIVLFGMGVVLGGVILLAQEPLPPLDDPFVALKQTTYVCTAEIEADCSADVAVLELSAGEDRQIVRYGEIPEVVINAVVAAEDKDYFSHHGLDPAGIGRALYHDIRERSASQGGSTITQQYVKNAFLTSDRTVVRKLKEAALAVKLNQQLSKEEILERYLNLIYFGRGAYGIQAAAQNYFGKNVGELDIADSAYLASLIRSPGTADAERDPEEATRRRATVLARMVADGYISQPQADEANARDWSSIVDRLNREEAPASVGSRDGSAYFLEAVRQQLVGLESELAADGVNGEVYTAGFRVYTTLDPQLQEAAFSTVTEVVDPRRDANDPSASLVAIDEQGRVVAMVGGYDFSTSQVNLAMGRQGGGSGRQPGSSFKTFVLAEAIEQGISAKSLYSAPSVIEIPGADNGNTWTVRGGSSPDGYRDLVDGLRGSSNVVYAQLMVDVGSQSVVELANRLGVSAELEPVNALVLGSGEVSVMDMAAAYSTISNQGVRRDPVLIERIEDVNGKVICWFPIGSHCQDEQPMEELVLESGIARQVTHALTRVVEAGTGRGVRNFFDQPAAGKTGTTQDARDAWFVGFSCDLTTAVWMGYPGSPGEPARFMSDFRGIEVHGGDFPAEMWGAFMAKASLIRGGGSPYPCDGLATQTDFPGKQLNPELSTTTLPPCAPLPPTTEPVLGEDGQPVATTAPAVGEETTTTEPCEFVELDPGEVPTTVAGEGETPTTADPGGTTTVAETVAPPTVPPTTVETDTTEAG